MLLRLPWAPASVYLRIARECRAGEDFAGALSAASIGRALHPGDARLSELQIDLARSLPRPLLWRAPGPRLRGAGGKSLTYMQAGWRRPMSTWTSPAHWRNSGDLVSALSTASTGQERHPPDASLAAQHIALATELAEKAAAAKEWTKAARHWQSVVDAYSGRQPPASAYLGLVRAHRSQGDFASARTIASSARSAYPHDTCLIKEHDEIESGYAEFACDLSQAIADAGIPQTRAPISTSSTPRCWTFSRVSDRSPRPMMSMPWKVF